jgi:hypothetical protein
MFSFKQMWFFKKGGFSLTPNEKNQLPFAITLV